MPTQVTFTKLSRGALLTNLPELAPYIGWISAGLTLAFSLLCAK